MSFKHSGIDTVAQTKKECMDVVMYLTYEMTTIGTLTNDECRQNSRQ